METEMDKTALRSLIFRMKVLMDEYDLRLVDIEAGPLLDEAEHVLEQGTCRNSVTTGNIVHFN